MREIKFRAWSNELGMSESTTLLDLIRHQTDFDEFEIYLQYTGLKDKNGTEIYEGDIVKFENVFSKKPFIGKLRYYAGTKPIIDNGENAVDIAECNNHDLEVLGNIYQNSELLEE